MLKFRRHIGAKLLAFLTGVLFLNMSFFLSEIRLLGLHITHTQMIENVVKALAGAGFEEEKDSMTEAGEEGGHAVDLHVYIHPMAGLALSLNSSKLLHFSHSLPALGGNAEIHLPPPKHA